MSDLSPEEREALERADAFKRIAEDLREVAHHTYCSGLTRLGEEMEAIADRVAALAVVEVATPEGTE